MESRLAQQIAKEPTQPAIRADIPIQFTIPSAFASHNNYKSNNNDDDMQEGTF